MKSSTFVKSVFSAIALSAGALFAETQKIGNVEWSYYIDNDTAVVSGAEPAKGAMTIPSKLGGLPVRRIDYSAFQACTGLTGVTVPEGVTGIDYWAFYNCTSLKTVSLPDSLVACDVHETFYGTPFLESKTFPAFVLSSSGKKLFGVKTFTGEWDYSARHDAVIPASVTEIADGALSWFYVRAEWDGEIFDNYVGDENNVRIVFAGAKPKASEKAFGYEFWDEEDKLTYQVERKGVYYRYGTAGWTWGADWCGLKTYALPEVPSAYARTSSLKVGRVYGGEAYSASDQTEHYIWDNNDAGLYGDEYAFIPVTGTGTITPVVYGDISSGWLDAAEVWSDQKMFDTYTPKGVAPSKWEGDEDDDRWFYADEKSEWDWPKAIWPDNKVVSGRRWIVIHVKEAAVWAGVWAFRVGLAGTSEISDPIVVVPSEEFDENGLLSKLTPSDFFRGVTITGYENFEAWDDEERCVADYESTDYPDCPQAQTYEISNWKSFDAGKTMKFKVELPSAGTLVVAGSSGEEDSGARKGAFAVSGSGIQSDQVTETSDAWELDDPNDRYNITNFWKTSNASHIRRIKVSKATTLTFKNLGDDDDCEFNRMHFFPASGKSVAIDAGYLSRENLDGKHTYWGRNYVQGYVIGTGVYKSGETATIKAVAGDGEQFDHWVVHFGNLKLTAAQKTAATLSFKVTDAMCGAMADEAQIFLTAVWKPKYRLTALPSVVGAGTVTGSGRYFAGEKATLKATAAAGYVFTKWSDGVTSATRTVTMTAADAERVVYACFETTYTIRFHRCDASDEKTVARKFNYGVSTKLPTLAALGWARKGFDFKGWANSKANADAGKVWNADGAAVAKPVTSGKTLDVYAVWAVKSDSYAIRFIRNDGAGTWRTTGFTYGVSTKLPTLAGLGWARRGYDFKGWASSTANAAAGTVWRTDGATVSTPAGKGKTLDVYAIWKLKAGYYQIRYNKNDGTTKWRAIGFEYGKSTKLNTIAGLGWERAGYDFKGWAISKANASAGKVWKTNGAVVSKPVAAGKTLNVYAIWQAKNAANAVTSATMCVDGACVGGTCCGSEGCCSDDACETMVYTGELADGSGVYRLLVEPADASGERFGNFCIVTESSTTVETCKVTATPDGLVLQLERGDFVLLSPDGIATPL